MAHGRLIGGSVRDRRIYSAVRALESLLVRMGLLRAGTVLRCRVAAGCPLRGLGSGVESERRIGIQIG